jgi:hypothetical protein
LSLPHGARLFSVLVECFLSRRAAALGGTLNAARRTLNGFGQGGCRGLNIAISGAAEQANAADRE